ncbi:ferredoxin [Rhodococcus sp. ACS1]|uniref:ferredoxin n=1 Tax=Rhodococcus sp. ACS1 TaxID=2028570 RepID=UPI000BB10146|nr:ferredoxin [Rhodococcus sp. ACS1]PBC39479.1 ferredoxin [Rhodococcus sp. ACS1]
MNVHVSADLTRCQGHARCLLAAPEVFDVDDYGKVVILDKDVTGELVSSVEEAVANCPETALSLTRDS